MPELKAYDIRLYTFKGERREVQHGTSPSKALESFIYYWNHEITDDSVLTVKEIPNEEEMEGEDGD